MGLSHHSVSSTRCAMRQPSRGADEAVVVGPTDDEQPRLAVDLGSVRVVERRVRGGVVGSGREAHGTIHDEVLRPCEEGQDGGQPLADLGQWSPDAAGGAVVEDGIGGEDRPELVPPAGIEDGRIPVEKVVDLPPVRQEAQLIAHAPEGTADRHGRPGDCVLLARLGPPRLVRVGPWHETSSRGTAGRNRSARANGSACTCRRQAGGRCGSRWHGSARGARSCSAPTRSLPASTRRRPTPPRRGAGGRWHSTWTSSRPGARATTRSSWRSTSARRCGATTRSSSSARPRDARIVLALATNTWHAYNDFGGPNLYTGGTHVALQRPMAAGYLYKPPGKGRRVTGTGEPDPQNAAHVGYIQINHLSGYAGSAGWPDWELPFIQWAEREGFEIGVCTNADLEEHPEVLRGREPVPLRRARRVLVTRHARHGRGVHRAAAATRRSSRATRRCGRCASRATTTT